MKDAKLLCLIERSQMSAAKASAKAQGISLAEVVRRALNQYLSKHQRASKGSEGPSMKSALAMQVKAADVEPLLMMKEDLEPTKEELLRRIEALERKAARKEGTDV